MRDKANDLNEGLCLHRNLMYFPITGLEWTAWVERAISDTTYWEKRALFEWWAGEERYLLITPIQVAKTQGQYASIIYKVAKPILTVDPNSMETS